jgi:hypothetical protein
MAFKKGDRVQLRKYAAEREDVDGIRTGAGEVLEVNVRDGSGRGFKDVKVRWDCGVTEVRPASNLRMEEKPQVKSADARAVAAKIVDMQDRYERGELMKNSTHFISGLVCAYGILVGIDDPDEALEHARGAA